MKTVGLTSTFVTAVLGFCLQFGVGSSQASIVERALMPGEVITGHAKYEDDCDRCHLSFDQSAQAALCADCHDEIKHDLDAGQGMHGRLPETECRTCHTDHKGRDARIAEFDQASFDHAKTDFALVGGHAKAECVDCHTPDRTYRETPSGCVACHRDDDPHKDSFDEDCAACHVADDWLKTEFDHALTGFDLLGKHADVVCADCHVEPSTKVALDTQCVACHRDDDTHKGAMDDDCAACHSESDWTDTRYDHRDTGFALLGKHQQIACIDCHRSASDYGGLEQDCASCHAEDDAHRGGLGKACGDCHDAARWDSAPKFRHDKTEFALDGAHRDAQCRGCHADAEHFHDTSTACVACHREDDKHEGRLGEQCGDCHSTRKWDASSFDHNRDTEFVLHNAHAKAECADCHKDGVERPSGPRSAARDCIDCHADDDPHEDLLGKQCADCHGDVDWKETTFNHARTDFPLIGAHLAAECKACHLDATYRSEGKDCIACHRDDDQHEGSLGSDCSECHNVRDWALWEFDHDRQTDFPLTNGHRGPACAACHKGDDGLRSKLDMACVSCHAKDDPHDRQLGNNCASCHQTTTFGDLRPATQRSKP